MKKGVLLPLIVAIIAAMVYFIILGNAKKKADEGSKPVRVFVATRDLPERRHLVRTDVRPVTIPQMYVQKDAFLYNTEADFQKITNAVSMIQIPKGNQITKGAITSMSAKVGLGTKVPAQWRGFVLEVPSNVGALIKPDDKVDILLTFSAFSKATGKEDQVTATILQRVTVLGVGNDLGQGMSADQAQAASDQDADIAAFSDTSFLSLALDPRDAQYLALARTLGDITVVIRNQTDNALPPLEVASFSTLFN